LGKKGAACVEREDGDDLPEHATSSTMTSVSSSILASIASTNRTVTDWGPVGVCTVAATTAAPAIGFVAGVEEGCSGAPALDSTVVNSVAATATTPGIGGNTDAD
jgi:hypothetical protein